MIEIIAFIIYSLGLVGIGLCLGYDIRKSIDSEGEE